MADWYVWIKALHVVADMAWMAGMLYLPRLFVYHVGAIAGSQQSETFKIMERRLLKAIMYPALIVSWITGLVLAYQAGFFQASWLQSKLALVIVMSAMHGYSAVLARDFATDSNKKTALFFRVFNEIPTILLILIVVLVVVKPF